MLIAAINAAPKDKIEVEKDNKKDDKKEDKKEDKKQDKKEDKKEVKNKEDNKNDTKKDDEKYTSKYDNIDVKGILKSERLLQNYLKCMKDEGPCPPEAKELKKHLQDALETDCSKCTDRQKEHVEMVAKTVIEKHPEDWKIIAAKYDPDHKFSKKYEKLAEEHGIKLPK